MQGYFNYKLEGTKEELEKALCEIEELAETDEDFETLVEFISEDGIINYSGDEGAYELVFTMGSSGNIGGITFLFDDMMYDLCKMFKELKISGTGYLLDFPPYPEWLSERGNSDYSTHFSVEMEYDFPKEDYLDNKGELLNSSIEVDCCCETTIELELDELTEEEKENFIEDGYVTITLEKKCDFCGSDITCHAFFS